MELEPRNSFYQDSSKGHCDSENLASLPSATDPCIDTTETSQDGGASTFSSTERVQGIDVILSSLGRPGKYVVLQVLMINLCYFSICFPLLSYVFIGYTPPHKCARVDNESLLLEEHSLGNDSTASVQYDQCNIRLVSNSTGEQTAVTETNCLIGFDFGDHIKHSSFVSDWDMVCEHRTALSELTQSVVMIGHTIGAIVLPYLSDMFGRKPVVIFCAVGISAMGVCSAYAPNLSVLIAIRCASGVVQNGLGIVAWALQLEWMVPRYRRACGIVAAFFWMVSLMTLTLVAYLLREFTWRALPIATACSGIPLVLIYPYFLDESPRWLSVNNKHDKCLSIFKSACKVGGKDFKSVEDVYNSHVRDVHAKGNSAVEDIPRKSKGVTDIFKHRELLMVSIILYFIWVTNTTTYYGLFIVSSSLAGSRYLNFMFMSMVDFPGEIMSVILTERVGRKVLIMGLLSLTGCCLLSASFLIAFGTSPATKTLGTILSFVGKFGIGPSFTAIYVYTPEVFPTNVRSTGLGLCNAVSRIGGGIAPYSTRLAELVLWAPGAIFSGMCFLSAAMMAILPETKGRPLPNTIEELREIHSRGRLGKRRRSAELQVEPDSC